MEKHNIRNANTSIRAQREWFNMHTYVMTFTITGSHPLVSNLWEIFGQCVGQWFPSLIIKTLYEGISFRSRVSQTCIYHSMRTALCHLSGFEEETSCTLTDRIHCVLCVRSSRNWQRSATGVNIQPGFNINTANNLKTVSLSAQFTCVLFNQSAEWSRGSWNIIHTAV